MVVRDPLQILTLLFGLGVLAQWLAWSLGIPSILLLLATGLALGPGFGLIDPVVALGPSTSAVVSMAVAVILFEGGLTLRLHDLASVGGPVRRLTTVGVGLGWALYAGAAYWAGGFRLDAAVLLGAILVVTGPTVIAPLLRHVRPRADLARAIRWESIVNDPTGAILSVAVFELMVAEGGLSHPESLLWAVGATFGVGLAIGVPVALLLLRGMERRWIPAHLEAVLTLVSVLAVSALAGALRHEAGLVGVTAMGMILANQERVPVRGIIEFKEHLQVLLISFLFVLLSARLDRSDLAMIDGRAMGFVAVLLLVARPLAILGATMGTGWTLGERFFVAWMAPRGIVAAAVTSVFALGLEAAGHPDAARLLPTMFLVIVASVSLYGLTAAPLARTLGLSESDPQGLLILGAHVLGRELCRVLSGFGFRVVLLDSDWSQVTAARMAGLEAWYGNALSEDAHHRLDLSGIGRFVAMSGSDGVDSLASVHFAELLGRENVFQLVPSTGTLPAIGTQHVPGHLRGRPAFGGEVTYRALAERAASGAKVRSTRLTEEFDLAAFRERNPSAIPLFVVEPGDRLQVVTGDSDWAAGPGCTLVSLVPEEGPSDKAGGS